MKLMNCPLNGPRNISEFVYGGELEMVSDPGRSEASEWAEHVFFHDNPAGVDLGDVAGNVQVIGEIADRVKALLE